MCGRYTSTSTSTPAELAALFKGEDVEAEELQVRYNVAPIQLVYAIAERRLRDEDEQRQRQLRTFK
jgi:putative SOS response-associated peptidase YedK